MNIGKENETIEFKKSTAELKQGINSISAILNKHGKGIIYFGVKDNGDVCGQQIGKDTVRNMSRDIRNYIKPEFEFEINIKNSNDNKQFVEVLFNGDRTPYSSYGKYFIRFSDQDRQMTSNELQRYFENKFKDYSSWEMSDSNVLIVDIDEELVENKVNNGHDIKRIPFKYNNLENILSKLGLLTDNKKTVNNAGNVIFSKNKPILLKLATYATKTKDTFIKLEHFQGNIYECLNKAMSYILETIDWKVELDGSLERKEEPEIPTPALREIIVNSFCHAKYDSNTSFEISIFKDRVSIYSPGFFPSGYIPEDFALNHEEPIMLNPKIVNTLFKTGEIESFGYGFEKTFKICNEKNVKYKYENTKSGFRFTFYRPLTKQSIDILSDTENKIFDLIKEDNYIENDEIIKRVKKSERTVYRTIKKLIENGYIVKDRDNNNEEYWKII